MSNRTAQLALVIVGSLFLPLATQAADPPATIPDSTLTSILPDCGSPVTLQRRALTQGLPKGFKAEIVAAESKAHSCQGQYGIFMNGLGYFNVGAPWILTDFTGPVEQKIRDFAWQRMQESFNAKVDAQPGKNGMRHAVLDQKTEYGSWTLDGWVDPEGKVFFSGDFFKIGDDVAKARMDRLAKSIAAAPSQGPSMSRVTVIEFSDFQCPSCKVSSSFFEPILSKYRDQMRYVRIDLPLMKGHPWAAPAAIAGRAIHRQSPADFWLYKKQVYESQSTLSAFTIWDFAKNFVQDHDLDVAKYEADIASAQVRNEILEGIGTAFTLGVQGTPTFMVDGVFVDAGEEGSHLEAVLAKKIGK